MKVLFSRQLEIVLLAIMIVGLFLPFIADVSPFTYAFIWSDTKYFILLVSLPVALLIPVFFLLIFKGRIKKLRLLRMFTILLYLLIFGTYTYTLVEDLGRDELEIFMLFCPLAMLLSLILVWVSFIRQKEKVDFVIDVFLAMIALPFIHHWMFLVEETADMQFGGWLIEGAFVVLYTIRLLKALKSRSVA